MTRASARRAVPALLTLVSLRRRIPVFRAAGAAFPRPRLLANIVKQASFTGVMAVGMTFVLLTAGIDLSVGSNMYLSAMAAGYVLQNPGLQNPWGVAFAIAAGVAAGRSSAPSTASASWCCGSRRFS